MTRVSVIGLYNYNTDLFSSMSLPDGVDRDVLRDTILAEASDLEVLYPDPDIFVILMKQWSRTMLPIWSRIQKAVTEEYNPLYNYDRTETHDETTTGNESSNGTTTDKVAGYNSSSLENSSQNTNSDNNSSNGSTKYTHRAYGNIGVTTSQQMLQAELDIAHNTNIYQIITTDFIRKFCIQVY